MDKYKTATKATYADSSYGNIRDMLGLAGIKSHTQNGYSGQIGFTLNKRTPVDVGYLLAAPADDAGKASQNDAEQLQTDFGANTGGVDKMFIALPNIAPALVQDAVTTTRSTSSATTTYGVCAFASNTVGLGDELSPWRFLLDLLPKDFTDRLKINDLSQQEWDWFGNWDKQLTVNVLKNPLHGKVDANASLTYYANQGYRGKDSLEVLVSGKDMAGRAISMKLIYFINVVSDESFHNIATNYSQSLSKYCHVKTESWRIARALTASSPSSELSQYSPSLYMPSINITVGDLGGSAIGQEATDGSKISITLDANAASYGWFIDAKPTDNQANFLPTSNPDVWMAKPGSAADGKMDLLSVLLHEYGHALGFDHSPDNNDFMGPDLQPGERRLPSPDELALMSKLVAQLNGDSATPGAPGTPSPLPLGGGTLALVLAGRLRRNGYGASTMDAQSARLEPQDLHVTNPTLTQGNFDTNTGWSTQGSVQFANNSATLSEGTGSQTRLSQSFTLGTNDKFLRFTVSNIALQNPGDRPEDAFQVALLNATTGASLGSAIDLSQTDALLNLQGDGNSHMAQGITVVNNADGSRTYIIDLRSVPTGTAVNLSFDLIGFEPSGSHVTISDVATFAVPHANDASFIGNENGAIATTIAGNVLVNDTNLFGAVPKLVTGPAHGTLTLNPDGSFVYTPNYLFYGDDSFTYLLDNGAAQSNTATIHLSVAHVNQPPTATDQSLSLLEDGNAGRQGNKKPRKSRG